MKFDENYKFFVPIKFYSGAGRFAELGKLCRGIGKKFLLVTGKTSMKKMGLHLFGNDRIDDLRSFIRFIAYYFGINA